MIYLTIMAVMILCAMFFDLYFSFKKIEREVKEIKKLIKEITKK